MAQITTGVRSVLSLPAAYDALQNLLGARAARVRIIDELLRLEPGQTLLDVGCGTGAILDALDHRVNYIGIDLSDRYIATACRIYGDRGTFICGDVAAQNFSRLPPIDVAMAIGLLHHLDDDLAITMLRALRDKLPAHGRLVTVDPCYTPDQSRLARWTVSRDRGQNVRTPEGYRALAMHAFRNIDVRACNDLSRVPYTHAFLECTP